MLSGRCEFGVSTMARERCRWGRKRARVWSGRLGIRLRGRQLGGRLGRKDRPSLGGRKLGASLRGKGLGGRELGWKRLSGRASVVLPCLIDAMRFACLLMLLCRTS